LRKGMDIKRIIKHCLSPIQKIRYHIKNSNGFIYIGKGCKIVGAKNIFFDNDVSIMPYTMLVAHDSNSKIRFGKGTQIRNVFEDRSSKQCGIWRICSNWPSYFYC